MDELIKRAFEVRDTLRHCATGKLVDDCIKCPYYKIGYDCYYALMLDTATVIEKLIEEVGK